MVRGENVRELAQAGGSIDAGAHGDDKGAAVDMDELIRGAARRGAA